MQKQNDCNMKTNQKPTYHELERRVAELQSEVENKNNEIASLKEEYSTTLDEIQAIVDELKLSGEKYKGLIENSIDAIVLTDETGNVLEWNKAMVNLTGIKPGEAQKKKIWELQYDMMLPKIKTKEIYETTKQKFSEFYSSRKIHFPQQQYETQIIGNGELKNVLQSTFAIRTDKGYRLASVIRDITKQKKAEKRLQESEKRYRFVTDRIEVFLYMTNPAGEFIFTSGNAKQFFGISSDEIKSNTIHEIFYLFGVSEKLKNQILQKTQRAIARHQKNTIYEFSITINNQQVWVKICEEFIYDKKRDIEAIIGMVQNITIQKKMEQAIKESEEKYRMLVENSNDMVTVFYGFDLVYVSPQVKSILGYQPHEFLNSNHWELIHPHDKTQIYELQKQQTKNKQFGNKSMVYRQKHKNGQYIWVETSGTTRKRNDGEIITVCNTRDITERRNAEQILRESEEKYRLTVDNSPDAIITFRYNELVSVSPAFYLVLGYTPKEFESASQETFFMLIHPEDRVDIMKKYSNGIKNRQKLEKFQYRIKRKNGDYIWIDHYANRKYDSNGKPEISVVIARDITKRVQTETALLKSEEKFRTLVENQGEGIAITNDKEIFVFANPAAEHIFGVSAGELKNRSLRDFVSTETLEKILHQTNLRKQGKKTTYDVEIIQPSGKKLSILVTANPQIDDQNNYTGTFGIFRDITDLKNAERILKDKTHRLKQLNATKDRLFAIISHDLKGPVHNMIGLSELIDRNCEKYSKEKIRKFNLLIYQSARTLSELLENLLIWSRTQRNKIVFQPEMVYIHSIVDMCFELLYSTAHKKQIKLDNQIPEDAVVYADSEMISTVIRNLISNALKFTPQRGIIQLQCYHEKNDLIITVSDTGIGIEPDRINKLFNIDENESTNGTDGEKGTGLGLIICKEFVEKNNGRIWVESKPDKGSIFYIALPKSMA